MAAVIGGAVWSALPIAVGVWFAWAPVRRASTARPSGMLLGRAWGAPGSRAEARAAEAGVLDTCEAVAADLRAGATPEAALDRAAVDWPALAPVARAVGLGADVPGAWRVVARLPGCADLDLVAAAWQVSQHSGGALARAMTSVATRLRRLHASRRVVASELASARATARMMAGLPLLAWAMGGGVGGEPLAFLLGSPWGWACLAAGVLLNLLGLWWIRRIADSIEGSR